MNAGLHYDISNSDYHAGPGVSKSALDLIAKSPAHYAARYLDPNAPAQTPTASMIAGTLAHCAALEPAEFDARYVVAPDVDRRTKDGKAAFEAFQAEAAGREIIAAEQRATAFAQAASLRRLPDIATALANGRPEVSAYWIDDETGVLCKCRPDWVHECDEGVILVDAKTTQDASPREFARSVAKWRYEVQAAWYSHGYTAASGRDVLAFVFAVVESAWPYFSAAYMLDAESIIDGRRKYRRDLNTFAACQLSGAWPGYSTSIEEIRLPEWAFTKE